MPTDAELRRLFHDAPSPKATIDPDAIIRRSRRRRLPQQLGAGSVLTLAAAGIGVASINGLQSLAPMGAAETSADAPMGASESSPFGGKGVAPATVPFCAAGGFMDAELQSGIEVAPAFPASAELGQRVSGTLTLTNTGTEPVTGTALSPLIALSLDGVQVWHSDGQSETPVALDPGESMTLPFDFDAIGCDSSGEADRSVLEPGQYQLTAVVTLAPDSGPVRTIGGPASTITLR